MIQAAQRCSDCGRPIEPANAYWVPAAGEFIICPGCGSLCVFDDNLYLRKPTVDETIKAYRNRLIREVTRDIRQSLRGE